MGSSRLSMNIPIRTGARVIDTGYNARYGVQIARLPIAANARNDCTRTSAEPRDASPIHRLLGERCVPAESAKTASRVQQSRRSHQDPGVGPRGRSQSAVRNARAGASGALWTGLARAHCARALE